MTQFHCTKRATKAAEKAKHAVADECSRLKAVLRANPEYGRVVPGTGGLRKMRVRVKGFKGQSGGYRTIYSKHDTSDGVRIAFHAVYCKSDIADLSTDQYKAISTDAAAIARHIADVAWSE